VEEIEDRLVFDGKRSRKYEDINQPKKQIKSEDKLDSMLSLIQSSLKEISNKQEKYDRSLEEIRSQVGIGNPTIVSSLNPSGSLNFPQTPIAMGPSYVTSQYRPQFPPQYVPTDFFSPVQGKAQIPATTMGNQGQSPALTQQMNAMMQANLNMLGLSDIPTSKELAIPKRKKDQDKRKVISFADLCSSLNFILEWVDMLCGSSYIYIY